MTYASGGLIQATDYNNFAASVNALWGTGSGDSGYGQTSSTLATVAASNTVSALQWQNLIDRINSMRGHQSGATSGLTRPNSGDVITFLSAMSTQISTITTNRLLVNPSQSGTSTFITNATGWVTSSVKELTFTWASGANAMRHFFNGGGYILFHGANSTLSGNTKSTDWDALLIAAGGVRINAQTSARYQTEAGALGGTPSVNNTNLGFYDLTTSYQTILQQYSTNALGGYNLNYVTYQARLNAAPGSSTILYVQMILTDAAGDVLNDTVSGTVRFDGGYYPPPTTYLTQNSWGTVSIGAGTNTQS